MSESRKYHDYSKQQVRVAWSLVNFSKHFPCCCLVSLANFLVFSNMLFPSVRTLTMSLDYNRFLSFIQPFFSHFLQVIMVPCDPQASVRFGWYCPRLQKPQAPGAPTRGRVHKHTCVLIRTWRLDCIGIASNTVHLSLEKRSLM